MPTPCAKLMELMATFPRNLHMLHEAQDSTVSSTKEKNLKKKMKCIKLILIEQN